jgi:hypothetical protein
VLHGAQQVLKQMQQRERQTRNVKFLSDKLNCKHRLEKLV